MATAQDQEQAKRDIESVMAALAGRTGGRPARKLTGPERAAVLMLALGEQHGGKIWNMLDDDELRELSVVMSTLGTIEAESVENLLLEFVGRMSASGALMGNYDATERLLHQFLPPERVGGIMDAEAAAFARGVAQGAAEARAEAEKRSLAIIERIATAMAALDQQIDAVEAKFETEAVEVAVAVAKKLAPELVSQEPFAEIAALAIGCFRNLVKCPHVVVRVNDALHETGREKLDEIVRRLSPDTKLVLLAEPEIAPGDCRIEWADGGIERDSAAIAAAIDEAVARYINARRSGAGANGARSPNVRWR